MVEGQLTRKPRSKQTTTGTPAGSRSLADALASLRTGMTPGEVTGILGKPVSTDKDADRLFWHYEDDFDVMFVDGRLRKVRPR
jgi:outer membrane protein assembly factor BamE (lipoprotein component of BamABCDE complex)